MKKYFFIFLFIISISFSVNAQFNGKPLYDVLVRQYPDTFGTFRMELYPSIAPLHCENFDTLAQQGFYDSLAFHRIVPNFVIQGGDPNSKNGPPSSWGTGAPWQQTVPAEFNPLAHTRSTIGAARGSDINSATSQFYVNLANNSGLNGNYTLYGKVISGMNVVDSVEAAPTDANERPLDKIDMFINYVGEDTSAPSLAPNLLSPADSAIDLFGNESFSWSAVNSNDFLLYTIQFSKQSDFSTIEYSKHISRNNTSVQPLSNLEQGFVSYYWRVLTNNGGKVNASDSRYFTTYIESPSLIRPLDQANNTFTNPIFEWSSVPGASQYNIKVSTLPVFVVPHLNIVDTITWKTDFAAPPLANNTTYYWGVRSIQNGVPGDYSEVYSFRTGTLISGTAENIQLNNEIYPNPNGGVFVVKTQKGLEGILRISDLNGHLILEKVLTNNHAIIDISSEADGLYFYTIISGNRSYQGKIIKRNQ